MSWAPLTDEERKQVDSVYATFKGGRDGLWAAVKRKFPDSEISQRTILNDYLKYQTEYQTHVKPPKPNSVAPLQITQPGYWQCDNVSMRTFSDSGWVGFFHMIDGFTKLGYGKPLRSEEEQETTDAAKKCIEEIRAADMKISVIQCDNGSTFQQVFRDMLESFGIKIVYSQVARAQANAFVERRGGVYKTQLYKMMEAAGDKKWVKNFQTVIANVNATKSVATGFSPDELSKGSEEELAQAAAMIKGTIAKRYKTGVVSTPLFKGQNVRVKRIRSRFQKPGLLGYYSKPIYKVVQRLDSTYANMLASYRIADAEGRVQYGRYPLSSLLKVPPILSEDAEDAEGAEEDPATESDEPEFSHIVRDVELPDSGVAGETVRNELVPTTEPSAPRRSLRAQKNGEYEAEAIVGKRGKGRRVEYKVRWLGYSATDDTWEPISNLENCKDLIAEYDENEAAS